MPPANTPAARRDGVVILLVLQAVKANAEDVKANEKHRLTLFTDVCVNAKNHMEEVKVTELKPAVKAIIDDVFAQQKVYALALRKSDYKQRLAVLGRFEKAFTAAYDDIHKAAAADFDKPEAEVDMAEIMPVRAELKHIRKSLKSWMKPEHVRATLSMFGTKSRIVKEPKGVNLVVSPWNNPLT